MKKIIKNINRNVRIGHVGEAILGILVAGTVVTTFALFPGVTHLIAPFIKKKKYSPRHVISKNLKSFVASGLVKEIINSDGSVSLKLTKKGLWEASLRHGSIPSLHKVKQKWDGVWRIVIFDIPNEKNRTRTNLRRAMHMYGFKPVQKSVWVYPFECDNFISLLRSHLDISRDVLYMKVSYIENDRHLRKEFSL